MEQEWDRTPRSVRDLPGSGVVVTPPNQVHCQVVQERVSQEEDAHAVARGYRPAREKAGHRLEHP